MIVWKMMFLFPVVHSQVSHVQLPGCKKFSKGKPNRKQIDHFTHLRCLLGFQRFLLKCFTFPKDQRNYPLGRFWGPQNDPRLPMGFRILRVEKFGEDAISILDLAHVFPPKFLKTSKTTTQKPKS